MAKSNLGYIQTPMVIIHNENTNPIDYIVYGIIYAFGRGDNICRASNKKIAETAGCSVSAVRHSLKRLEQQEYIARVYKTNKQKQRQRIRPMVVYKKTTGGTNEPGVGTEKPPLHNKTKEKESIKRKRKQIRTFSSHYKKKILKNARLTKKAKKKIALRLQEYPIDKLKKAINNFSDDDWNMDNNAHRGMAWFCNSEDRIEGFLNLKSSQDWQRA